MLLPLGKLRRSKSSVSANRTKRQTLKQNNLPTLLSRDSRAQCQGLGQTPNMCSLIVHNIAGTFVCVCVVSVSMSLCEYVMCVCMHAWVCCVCAHACVWVCHVCVCLHACACVLGTLPVALVTYRHYINHHDQHRIQEQTIGSIKQQSPETD